MTEQEIRLQEIRERREKEKKIATTKEMWANPEIRDIIKWLQGFGKTDIPSKGISGVRGNKQNIGIDPFNPVWGWNDPTLTDWFINATTQPKLLDRILEVFQGIYDPKSEANLAKIKDYQGEREIEALTTTLDALTGDDVNILDIVSTLQPSEEQLQEEEENPLKIAN